VVQRRRPGARHQKTVHAARDRILQRDVLVVCVRRRERAQLHGVRRIRDVEEARVAPAVEDRGGTRRDGSRAVAQQQPGAALDEHRRCRDLSARDAGRAVDHGVVDPHQDELLAAGSVVVDDHAGGSRLLCASDPVVEAAQAALDEGDLAGRIGEVRVGDRQARARAVWGEPVADRPDSPARRGHLTGHRAARLLDDQRRTVSLDRESLALDWFSPTTAGQLLIAVQAVGVAALATLQYAGLRQAS
jgi:hypothetical protein